MTQRWRLLVTAIALATTLATTFAAANAQQNRGPANPLQGFSTNKGQPVKIRAASLEVRDKDKVATFSGDVQVIQGDTELRCKNLIVYYEGGSLKDSMQGEKKGPAGQPQGQIRRMEAKGGVVVSQKDQVATGDSGVFDMRTNTVTLIGNVVVTKGEDVLKGQRLVVDLTNGVSRVESGPGRSSSGRVEVLIGPKSQRQGQESVKHGSAPQSLNRPGRSN
jgi:lipopolysaccharide export system protein LptA